MKHFSLSASLAIAAVSMATLAGGIRSASAGWQVAWSDEFDGSAVDTSKWTFETGNGSGGWGNNEREYYTSRTTNAYVANGALHIVARQESMRRLPLHLRPDEDAGVVLAKSTAVSSSAPDCRRVWGSGRRCG